MDRDRRRALVLLMRYDIVVQRACSSWGLRFVLVGSVVLGIGTRAE